MADRPANFPFPVVPLETTVTKVFLFMILSNMPTVGQLTLTRDIHQCEYVAQNLLEDIKISGQSGEVYCVSLPVSGNFRNNGEYIREFVLKHPHKRVTLSPAN